MIKVSNLKSFTRGIDITMDSINHNTSLRTNKHLSYEERFFIEKQLQAGVSKTAIANALGRSRTTIQSEIQRGSVEQIKAGIISPFLTWVEEQVLVHKWSLDAAVATPCVSACLYVMKWCLPKLYITIYMKVFSELNPWIYR